MNQELPRAAAVPENLTQKIGKAPLLSAGGSFKKDTDSRGVRWRILGAVLVRR